MENNNNIVQAAWTQASVAAWKLAVAKSDISVATAKMAQETQEALDVADDKLSTTEELCAIKLAALCAAQDAQKAARAAHDWYYGDGLAEYTATCDAVNSCATSLDEAKAVLACVQTAHAMATRIADAANSLATSVMIATDEVSHGSVVNDGLGLGESQPDIR